MSNTKGCYLYSKANYSIKIDYDGGSVMIPPFATKILVVDESKLGPLPDKVKKVEIVSEQVDTTDSGTEDNKKKKEGSK